MATRDGLWRERFPSELAEAAGALSESGISHRTGALDDTTEARR